MKRVAGPIETEVEAVGRVVLDAAFCVHTELGPGLLESIYEVCFEKELAVRGVASACQKPVPVRYRGELLDTNLRLDFIVGGCVIVELKAAAALLPIHTAQLMTYLKLAGLRLGYLINFNSVHLRDGIKRIVL